MFGIYDEAGNPVANYSRFENTNSKYNSIKLFDDDKNRIYTIATDGQEQSVYIIDKDGKRAKIEGAVTPALFKFNVKSDLKFYGKPYTLTTIVNTGFTDITFTYIVTYESKPVVKGLYTYNMISSIKKETTVNQVFLTDNKNDCMAMVLSIFAFDEMLYDKVLELHKENQMRQNNKPNRPK